VCGPFIRGDRRDLIPKKAALVGIRNQVDATITIHIGELGIVRVNRADFEGQERFRSGLARVQEQDAARYEIDPPVALYVKSCATDIRIPLPKRMPHPTVRRLKFPPTNLTSCITRVPGNPIAISISVDIDKRSLADVFTKTIDSMNGERGKLGCK